jgi:hypothetical protein
MPALFAMTMNPVQMLIRGACAGLSVPIAGVLPGNVGVEGVSAWIGASLAAVQGRPAPQPPTEPAAQPDGHGRPAGAGFTNADEVLLALETADRGVTSITAEVVYTRVLALAGDTQVRTGKLFFVAEPERRFAIDFATLDLGERRENDRQTFVFDGRWLLEKHWSLEEYVRREVVPEGERFDPLRIGEGPMPIPIGQRRADILSRYDAVLLPALEGVEGWEPEVDPAFLARTYQLRLTPRPERAEEDDFVEVRLWYRAERDGRLLPRMARTVNRNDDVALVQLVNPALNQTVDPAVLDTRAPEGWTGTVQPFRGETLAPEAPVLRGETRVR